MHRNTLRAYVCPARHFASDMTDPDLPPMGMRFRLKRSYPIAGFPRQARIVLQALKEYGMIVADNGSNWFVSGAPHPKWSNEQLHTLHRVPGSAFEVVDASNSPAVASAGAPGPRPDPAAPGAVLRRSCSAASPRQRRKTASR